MVNMNDRLTIDKLNNNGCINILSELLRQMTTDFTESYKMYLSDKDDPEVQLNYENVKEEFLSDYFANLTRLNGANIVRKLEAAVESEVFQCA